MTDNNQHNNHLTILKRIADSKDDAFDKGLRQACSFSYNELKRLQELQEREKEIKFKTLEWRLANNGMD